VLNAGLTPDGTLTNRPDLDVSFWSPDYTLDSLTLLPDLNAVGSPISVLFGEATNVSGELLCYTFPDIRLDGREFITLVEFPDPLREEGFSTLSQCVGPGGRIILQGVSREVTPELLANGRRLEVSLPVEGFPFEVMPVFDAPQLDISPVAVAGGSAYVAAGRARVTADIFNWGLHVYPRSEDGLLVDRLLAFPGLLAPLAAGTEIDVETDEVACAFQRFEVVQSWITDD
jgi:hypothetical protein